MCGNIDMSQKTTNRKLETGARTPTLKMSWPGHLWQVQHLGLSPLAFPRDEEAVLVDLEPAALLHLLLAPAVEGVPFQERLVHRDVPLEDKRLGHPGSTWQLRTWKPSKWRGFNLHCKASQGAHSQGTGQDKPPLAKTILEQPRTICLK